MGDKCEHTKKSSRSSQAATSGARVPKPAGPEVANLG